VRGDEIGLKLKTLVGLPFALDVRELDLPGPAEYKLLRSWSHAFHTSLSEMGRQTQDISSLRLDERPDKTNPRRPLVPRLSDREAVDLYAHSELQRP
jgi:hypothetical protein